MSENKCGDGETVSPKCEFPACQKWATGFSQPNESGRRFGACDDHRGNLRPEGPLPKADAVHHPAHYTRGIECWDFITSHGLGFLAGNVVKYVTRYRHKNGLEDLLKARQYLERLIKEHGGEPLTRF